MRAQNSTFIPNAQGQQSNIDTKNLTMIQDLLKQEAMAYKKCSVYAGYFADDTLISMANTAAAHHKQHFDALQNYMNSHK